MKAKVLAWCQEQALFQKGDRVCCALSGGGDSVAMVWCLRSLQEDLGITLSASHFNHRLRGKESDEDEAFVRRFCKANDIPLFVGSADVGQYAKDSGKTLEEAAREKRYEFFLSLPCDKIATAHTADDNAETVLLHLIRGSGLRGLCGIAPQREQLVRPLLSVTHEEIYEYLQEQNLKFCQDSTNFTDFCTRNRLRHHVMPLLKQEQPALSKKLLEQGKLLRQEDSYLDALASACLQETEAHRWLISPILAAPAVLQRRTLRLLMGSYLSKDVSQRHIEGLLNLLNAPSPSARWDLPQGLQACRVYDTIEIRRISQAVPLPGILKIEHIESYAPSMEQADFLLCWEGEETDLYLRCRQEGDTLLLSNGHRKTVKKLMIDRKIPANLRSSLAVLTDGKAVLAVEGLGISQPYLPKVGEPALRIYLNKGATP